MRRCGSQVCVRIIAPLLIAFSTAALWSAAGAAHPGPVDIQTRMTPFLFAGYSIRWNFQVNKLVYMKPGADRYYGLYLLDPDGRNERPLTSGNPLVPGRHMGAPFWHPSGRYIVFVAEKKEHPGGSMPALPGFGGWCDIWLITPDGLHAWKLVDEPVDPARAILLPCFSPDGKRLAWCERITRPKLLDNLRGAGTYIIHTADFVETPTPHVANIRDYRPAGEAFYETSCFTPDSQSLLMTSNCDTKNFWQNQIYRFDLATQQLHRLTHDTSYNEHPQVTPDGRSIIWMSDTDTDGLHLAHGTDWWLMDPDGSHPRRISTMNVRTSPQCDGKAKWACTVTWSPDGRWFYGDVQTNLITQAGKVVRVDLP